MTERAYYKSSADWVEEMLSVVIVAPDNEQRTMLQALVDGTAVASTVLTCASFPVAASDPVMRSVQAAKPDVLLVDIPSDDHAVTVRAIRAIELLHQELPDSAIVVIGNLNQPVFIVATMRAGASYFFGRPTTTFDLLEIFRLITARSQGEGNQSPGGSSGSNDPHGGSEGESRKSISMTEMTGVRQIGNSANILMSSLTVFKRCVSAGITASPFHRPS